MARLTLRRPELGPVALASYRAERKTDALVTVGPALLEGGFLGVIADKLFRAHPGVLALLAAAPMFGNLSSSFWARLGHGTPRVRMIVRLQLGVAACVAAIALAPVSYAGLVFLVALAIAARLLQGGIAPLRSVVWTLNYPRATRGRITARLSVISMLCIALTACFGGPLLDANPERFRWLYSGASVLIALGALAYAKVRLLGEEEHLAAERGSGAEDGVAPAGPSAWRVLREDRLYLRYLTWQMVLGIANMMIEAPLLYLVSHEQGASYGQTIALTQGIPFAVAVVTTPFWANLLDRMHVTRFRALHSWFFAFASALLWLGAALHSLALLAVARAAMGAARSGGSLAWSIGHNDFAPSERAGLYMGIHATLTGVRGMVAPFAGMLLYIGWSERALPGSALRLPAWTGIGAWTMLLSTVMCAWAALGFRRLHHTIRAAARTY